MNLTDQKYLAFQDNEDSSMIASCMAYDPETGAVFGCFNDKEGKTYEFAKMDHKFVDQGRSEAIATIDSPWQACGFTSTGQMYAVLADGSLATVDKATGATAKVKDLGLAGNDSNAGFLDTRDNLFYIYWSNRAKGEAALYVVDINDGCALYKAFTMPFYARMGSMVSLHNPVKSSAPGLATGTEVSFDGTTLNGKVKFTAPAKSLDGQELSGELSYSVSAGGKVLATGSCAPGAETEANITLPEAGSYYVRVRLGNSEGTGLWSQATAGVWAGPDVPVAPGNVKAEYNRDGASMKISWDAVDKGVHNGAVTPADMKYTVVKYVNGAATDTIATDIPDLEFTESVAWPESVTTVKYAVYATFAGEAGAGMASNTVVLGTIKAPWTEDFSDADALNRFTAYNDGKTASGSGNNTQNVWFRYEDTKTGNGAAQVYTTSKKNHYLVTAPIYMEPGKSYIFHAEASGFASSTEEKVEVLMGRGNAIEDLTTTLVPETSVKAIASKPVVLAKEITVDDSDLSAFSFRFYVQPEEEGKTRDEYIFYPILHDPYEGDVALSSPISTNDFSTPGWHIITVSLDKYRGQTVQPGVHVEFAGMYKQNDKYFLIDDIQIRQFADHDMMALTMEAPMLEPGEENILNANFRNIGYENADAFVVELYRNNEKVAESDPVSVKAGENGTASFKQTPGLFWDRTQDYHFNIVYGKDQLNFNNKSEAVEVEVLESRLPAVRDLAGVQEEKDVVLTWSAPDVTAAMTDDCEKYVPFSINRAGRWSFIDGDGLTTYPIVGDQFPGLGEPSAFIVWENINEERNFTHSGSKCFAAFPVDAQSDDDVNDDWLISPLLNGTAQTVSFWAFGNFGSSLWGSHVIEVLYSTTGKEKDDFVRVGEPITLADTYTQYSFDVPEGAQYFAIRYVQAAVSAIFIDDITFAQVGNGAEIEGYDVYCDGNKLNETMLTSTGFRHVAPAEGTHTYHVVALYKEGTSDLSNKSTVQVKEISGLSDVLTGGARVYTTSDAIHIDNAEDKVSVATPNGVVIYSNATPAVNETVSVKAGVYLVSVNGTTVKVMVK